MVQVNPRRIFKILILAAVVGGGLYLIISGAQSAQAYNLVPDNNIIIDAIVRLVFGVLMTVIGFPWLYSNIPKEL